MAIAYEDRNDNFAFFTIYQMTNKIENDLINFIPHATIHCIVSHVNARNFNNKFSSN
jgi:hypothetical protein